MEDFVAALHEASVGLSGDGLHAEQSVVGGSESSMSGSTGPSPVRRKVSTSRTKQTNFTAFEDNVLCKSWLEISCDPAVNTGQRKEAFWSRVCQRYSSKCTNYPERSQKSIMSRWDHIKAEVSKFAGYMADMMRSNPSGMTDSDKCAAAAAVNFAAIEKHNFALLHCWQILKDEPKWMDLRRRMDNPQNSASTENDLANEQRNFLDLDPDTSSPSRKRPMGRDAAKAAKKKAASASTEYASKMHDISVQKIELFKETETKKEARLDEMVVIEKVKAEQAQEHRQMIVELEKKRLAIEERRLQKEAEKEEKEEDERILAINLDECQPLQRLYYQSLQENIILKLQSRRRGSSQ